jgi:hypothetical protein
MGLYGDEYFVEYAGNQKDNESFSKSCEDLSKMFANKIEVLKKISEHLEKCVDIDARTTSELTQHIEDLFKDAETVIKECNRLERDSRSDKVTKDFNRIASKLKVKYSSATIEERKKYDDILVKYLNEISNIVDKFEVGGYNISRTVFTTQYGSYTYKKDNGSTWMNEFYKKYKIFCAIDNGLGEKYMDHVAAFYNKEFGKRCRELRRDLKFAIRKIDGEKDNRILYKLVQKIFKDKEENN